MTHYTLNTGHSRRSPRGEVADDVLRQLAGLMVAGRHRLPDPLSLYEVLVALTGTAYIATVVQGGRPLATFAVAPDDEAADALWPAMEAGYFRATELPGLRRADLELPVRPSETPWLAAYLTYANVDEAKWLGDLERCLAWAWIEHCRPDGDTHAQD